MRGSKLLVGLLLLLAFSGMTPGAAHADLLSDAIQDYQFQDLPQAEEKLRRLLASEPGNLMAHYYLGAVLQQEGKLDEAIRHYEIVAHAPQPIAGIEAALNAAYVAAGKPEKALPYFESLYRKNPADDQTAFDYATALQASGRSAEATTIYRRLIASNSRIADPARFQLAQILVAEGAYVSADKILRRIAPDSPYAAAAKSYIDALAPATRPLSIYASVEGFYNDNPGSASAATLGTATAFAGGSQGLTLIGSLNTRAFEASEHLRFKLGYLYYATYYRVAAAKQFDFTGHFVNPSVIYHFSPDLDAELKGDFQFFDFGKQKLSTNIGATLTLTRRFQAGHSLNLHAAYLDKRYTRSYLASGIFTSLQYLDARTSSFGLGTSLAGSAWIKGWNGILTLDYTYNDEKPRHTGDANALLAAKSLDSRYKEHAVRANLTLPLGSGQTRLSLLGNASYSHKDYSNVQSGNVYVSAAGQHMKSDMLITGGKIQALIWKKIGLNLAVGAERTVSHSQASELTYKSNRYFATLSGAY